MSAGPVPRRVRPGLPLFIVLLSGIVVTLGVGVFYQQQLTNAAREAARYAAIHSETSQCPTISRKRAKPLPAAGRFDLDKYFDCDPPVSDGLR